MKLRRISLTEFEGTTALYTLAPLTLVVGDNRAGKTTIPNAIRVAAYGHLPKVGPVKSRRLMSGTAAAVRADWDDGTASTVEWKKAATGSVSLKATLAQKFPEVLMDFGVWQKLTEQQRVSWAFGAAGGKLDMDAIREQVQKIVVMAPPAQQVEAVAEADALLTERCGLLDETGDTTVEWIGGLVDALKERAKASAQRAKDAQALLGGLREAAQRKVADPSKELAEAQKVLDEAREASAGVFAAARMRDAQSDLLASLERELADCLADAAKVEACRKEVATVQAKLSPPPHDVAKLAARRDAVANRKAAMGAKSDAAAEAYDRLQAEAEKLLEKDCCPTCKADGDEWKKRYRKDSDKRLKALAKERDEAAEEFNLLAEELNGIECDMAAVRKWDAEQDRVQAVLAPNRMTLAALETAAARVPAVREKLAKLPAAATAVDTESAARKVQEAQAKVRALEECNAGFAAWRRSKEQCDKAEADAVRHQAVADAMKAAAKVVTDAQSAAVAELFEGLLATANQFTDGFMPPVRWRDGEFGYETPEGQWVPADNFSGTEELVAFGGLCVALAAAAPCKIVLMDELGRLTLQNKWRLAERLAGLVDAGVIDQAVLVDVDGGWLPKAHADAAKAFKVIEVG